MPFGESFNGQTVDVSVGQTIEVRLQENPTTGFRWRLASDGGPACRIIDDALNAPAGPPGRGGEHKWTFEAIRTGECDIELRYARPWEGSEPGKIFTLHVRVEDHGRGAKPRP
jgi:inhibitor of cysteine peptidase